MNDAISVFNHRSYKSFLLELCGGKQARRGLKVKLAAAAKCQSTYISQVLHGKAELSPEQAERIIRFLKLEKGDAHYFMLLLQKDRAGTRELKKFYDEQIKEQIEKRLDVVNRLGPNNILNEEQKSIFYSSWHYLAIHMALTIPQLRTPESLAQYYNLDLERVDKVLSFLVSTGLATQNNNEYETGVQVLRLGKDSHHIFKHHFHWRQQSIESLEKESIRDLHYSAVITLSKEDVIKLKETLLDQIQNNVSVVRASAAEEVYVYNLDFFSLKKQR